MSAGSEKRQLQHENPQVLVIGDSIVDLFVYDKRAEDADQSMAWTSPLSRDDWHYAAGFETRQCVAGAAGIHAMLWANDIAVAGNSFRNSSGPRVLEKSGSIFVLRRKANAGKEKKDRTCSYLITRPEIPEGQKSDEEKLRAENTGKDEEHTDNLDEKYRKVSYDRDKTWRAAVNHLNEKEVNYVRPHFGVAGKEYDYMNDYKKDELQAVCLWDVKRGFFLERDQVDWLKQQKKLFDWYKSLWRDGHKPPIVIRTSDPVHFKHFLELLSKEKKAPKVILVCALTQLDDGDLRGSGTWSGVWSQVYDYLKDEQRSYLFDSKRSGKPNWRFNIVIPVHQDGALWIGPDRWPIEQEDRKDKYLGDDKLPLGSLFLVPGAQPGLSEFEEHGRLIGVHTLLTHAIIEHLAEGEDVKEMAEPIKQGLMRIRRLRSHGYGAPEELKSMNAGGLPDCYIGYPCEVWEKNERVLTDLLLKVRDEKASQAAGPYEMKCKVDFPDPALTARHSPLYRIFKTMEKKAGTALVASPESCICVAGDVSSSKAPQLLNEHWIKIDGKTYPIDSFSENVIETSRLRQCISMQFGKFAMAAPKEAGSILDLAQRVKQHVLSNRYNSPDKGSVFNFALFGSPGSGKSFLASQIASLIDPRDEIFSKADEYNLSQFTDSKQQLTDAFAVIASKSLGGQVPLVLWDEFDSVLDGKRGGWLSRFLMPMQDAHFFDGRERRPIGTAVFVFIGGTFPTADEFRKWACETEKNGHPTDAVLLKARDFHSRLYTALDMPSIIDEEVYESGPLGRRCQVFRTNWTNSYAKLARAVLLRQYFRDGSMIGDKAFLQSVDDKLCRFLLAIPLRHGARSLKRIVEACLVSKPSKVSILHLPPTHFLAEHIETENVRRDGSKKKGVTIEEMREACR